MKTLKYVFIALSFLMILPLGAQVKERNPVDQNPNYLRSMEKYMNRKDELLANQGETVQETYKAIQYWYDRQEAKQQWKIDRIEFRKQLRLERARRPVINNGWNGGWGWNRGFGWNRPWVQPFGGLNYFDGDWHWRYGLNFGLWPW